MDQSTSVFIKFLEDNLQPSSTKTLESQSSKSSLAILPTSIIRYTFSRLYVNINVLVYNGLLTFWTSNRGNENWFHLKNLRVQQIHCMGQNYSVWLKKGNKFSFELLRGSKKRKVQEIRSPLYNYVTAVVKNCLAKGSVIITLRTSQGSI